MIDLPYLREVFDLLKRGSHLSPEDEPYFSVLASRWEAYRSTSRQAGLRNVLNNMERFGWLKWFGNDEFRFLRPFHRVFTKCLEFSSLNANSASPTPS